MNKTTFIGSEWTFATSIRERFAKTILVIILIIIAINWGTGLQIHTAQAQTFEQRNPVFGMYCKDTDVIITCAVNFDLTNEETAAQGKGTVRSNYQISAVNRTVEFVIPFMSSATNAPTFYVTANEKKIDGSIWYGDALLLFAESTDFKDLIDNTYSPEISNNSIGTLFTVIPNDETISIELSFAEGKRNSFIYETSNNVSEVSTANGTYTWILKNAFIKSEYKFFILGERPDYTFSCSSEYQAEKIACKDFIDRQYRSKKEFYDGFNVGIEYFYSMLNKVLLNRQHVNYDDLFYNSINIQRFNVYYFTIYIDNDTTVSYDLPINIQRNTAFSPAIFLVEQKNLGKYPIRYIVELNDLMPYIIESSVKINKNNTIHYAESADDFYFICCSSQKPENIALPNNSNDNKHLLICCVVIGVGFILMVIFIAIELFKNGNRG